jgi:hypothetical protein
MLHVDYQVLTYSTVIGPTILVLARKPFGSAFSNQPRDPLGFFAFSTNSGPTVQ